ncbi:MAG TPA: rhodanese-like domain-containing protein [Anaeromyxobacteraceae bacterium]|nr:rhodanese-like domain-containing protein [Anaeromyxobacteraceae bacterium]
MTPRFATALAAAVALLASPARGAEATPPLPAPGPVDGATGHALAARGVKVVDVRTPEEFAEGHVPGAVNIPYDQIAARAAEIGPPATPVLLYCRSGRRSGIAAQALAAKSFTAIYDMKTFDAWKAAEKK